MHIHTHFAYIILVFSLLSFSLSLLAAAPKREMRATYLTSVANIDWPSSKGLSASVQKQELTRMLDSVATLNLNTVLFQIRPNADALYKSNYEPWSDVLTGTRGKDPGYDPLQFCIDECHKRGLECHAWMNPYRYSRTGAKWTGANDNPLNYENTHPEWLLYYSANIVLDPGLPEVEQRVKEVVGDVINNYEVDGVIFDDYFYPYGGTTTQDIETVQKYKPSGMEAGDWRRDNVRRMVMAVYDTIQSVKPWVTFGISPFGIWTTDSGVARKEGIALPSGIIGGNMYEEIYCDPVAWMKDGTIDYISPQLYWKIGGQQDYKTLCKWWADLANKFGMHFYSSMAIYRYAEKYESNKDFTVQELQNQENANRASSKDDAYGFFFYNSKAWVYDKAFRKAFRADQLRYPSLPPAINWKPTEEQPMVENLQADGQTITWTHKNAGKVRYSVYAIPKQFKNTANVWSMGEALLGMSYTESYTLPADITTASHAICIGVLDYYGNEYAMRILGEEETEAVSTTLSSPGENEGIESWKGLVFKWEAVKKADSYIIQIASDAEFENILAVQELTANSFEADRRLNLAFKGNGTYFWRVKTRRPNTGDIWSETRRFVIGQTDGIENTEFSEKTASDKPYVIIRDGQLLIVKGGGYYSLTGVRIE